MVGKLENDFKSFQKLFEEPLVWNTSTTSTRNKRGIIHILGYGLKYLFGTADA